MKADWRTIWGVGAVAPLLLAADPAGTGIRWKDCPGVAQDAAPAPQSLPACVAASGPAAADTMRVRLGEAPDALRAASTLPLDFSRGPFVTDTPVTLTWATGERAFVFENVGGSGQAILELDATDAPLGDGRVMREPLSRISFAWQNRPLSLEEAIARARRLEAWLADAGYGLVTDGEDRPFAATQETTAPATRWADGWDAAQRLLADDGANIEAMDLYRMTSADAEVGATLRNLRREAWNFDARGHIAPVPGARRSIFDGDGGYEWLLTIDIARPEPTAQPRPN